MEVELRLRVGIVVVWSIGGKEGEKRRKKNKGGRLPREVEVMYRLLWRK